MAIIIDGNTFTLNTNNTSYIMQADQYGYLIHLYYGEKVQSAPYNLIVYADRAASGNPYDVKLDRTYSLDALPQEFPFDGMGDYRHPSLRVRDEEGNYGCDLHYKSHRVIKKEPLKGLPAMRGGDALEITLTDDQIDLDVILTYGVYEDVDLITRSVKVVNHGKKITLEEISSANLDFVTGNFDVITFAGRHANERQPIRQYVDHGRYGVYSTRGASSHQYNPFMILCDHETTEYSGQAYAMSFVYSGNFYGEVEKDQFDQFRMSMGLHYEYFSYPVEHDESFVAPEVIMTYSHEGLSVLSQNLHQGMKKYLIRDPYQGKIRPILVNSWEAAYFDFTGETILNLAKAAKECDLDMVVLDDGWFGKRESDNMSLGDWYVNEEKLGGSLADLSKSIHDLGLKFGLWVEPECVNEDSDLYRKHPDYAIKVPGRRFVRSRNQLVLDFSRKEVVDAIYEQLIEILDHVDIDYIKWDFNRCIANVYSDDKDSGKMTYDYVLGVYDLLTRLIERYPELLIEGCCGGGGRFDAGMLYYTPQIWLSDNTDAIDRERIQYGSSFAYPISTFGSHVSAVPNHQTGRVTPLNTRGNIAMSGSFGYELDLTKLSDEEKAEIREQVKDYRKYQPLIHHGLYYRYTNPLKDMIDAYGFVSEDKEEALIFATETRKIAGVQAYFVRIHGLEKGCLYQDDEGHVYDANVLESVGMPLRNTLGEYISFRIHLTKK